MAEKKITKKPIIKDEQMPDLASTLAPQKPGGKIFPFLVLIVVLLPLFVLPWMGFSGPVAKKLIIALIISIAGVWASFKIASASGKISLPKSFIFYSAGALFSGIAIANFFSSAWRNGFIGVGFENNTVWSFLFAVIALGFFAVNVIDRRSLVIVYLSFWGASFVAIATQVLRIVIGNSGLIGFWPNAATNLVGKLNELGLLAGLFVIVSLIPLEYLRDKLTIALKSIIWIGVALALVVVIVANFALLWWVIGLTILLLAGISIWRNRPSNIFGYVRFSLAIGLLLVILAGLSSFAGSFVNVYDRISIFNSTRGIETLEVNPSWRGSLDIAEKVLVNSPVFGLGANNFSYGWSKYKPTQVNETLFWDVDFSVGFGTLPTVAINGGIVGILLVLIFSIAVLVGSVRLIWTKNSDPLEKTSDDLVGWGAIYLLAMAFVYPIETVGMMLLFAWSGLVIARLYKKGAVSFWRLPISFNLSDGKLPFITGVSVVGLSVIILVISISNIISLVYLQSGASLVNSDLTKGQSRLERSIFWRKTDLHYRVLTEAKIAQMNNLVSSADMNKPENVTLLQAVTDEAIVSANQAIKYNPTNYRNWVTLAQVYEFLTSLGVEGAYEQAISAYTKAKESAPTSPLIYLNLARLESAKNDLSKARGYIDEALKLKPNYSQAIFLLTQIETAQGNLSSAIGRAEKLAQDFPNDPTVLFQLGYVYFQADRFTAASSNFEKALNLEPNYADAAYFLGLSYDALDEKDSALGVFRRLLSANPGNATLTQIISNLENGKSALSSSTNGVSGEEE